MRVCIMTETYYPVPGGGERQARELAHGLVRRGHNVLVLTRRSSADLPRKEFVDGATVRRLPPVGLSRGKKWGLVLSGLWALLRHSRDYDAVVVCGFRILGIPAVLSTRILKRACTLKADSLGEMSGEFFTAGLEGIGLTSDFPPFTFFLRGRNRLFGEAENFVAISQTIVDELLDSGIDPSRVRVIPNSVDVERFKPASEAEKREIRGRLGLPERGMITAYTGRLVSYKGLAGLLRVWKALVEEGDPGLLLLVGGGGLDMHNCEEELRGFVRLQGMESAVTFAGEVENVEAYLQASDLFAFPSENEAFGISVIEAMATGLPVISSGVGGLRDILVDGQTGLVFPAGDEGALKEGIQRLLGDSDLRETLGRAGRAEALSRYSSDRVVEEYSTLFRAQLHD